MEPASASANLIRLVSATGLANLADGIVRVGLPLLATTMTPDPLALGALVACFTAPWILASFHVGVLVDRLDRRQMLCAAHLARFAAVSIILVGTRFGLLNLLWLYAAALVLGTAEVVAMTCETAIVPMAVRSERIPSANAWITGLETVGSESAGPALGGALMALDPVWMLTASAAAFLIAVGATTRLNGHYRPTRDHATRSMLEDGRAGLAYLLRRRDLRYMTLLVGVVAACWSAWQTLIVLFAVDPGPMHLTAQGYGALTAMLGVGGVVGALLATSIVRLVGRKAAMFSNVLGTTAMLGVPVFSANPALVGAAIFAAGLGSSVWSVNSRTIVQQSVPSDLVGRFYSIYRMLSWSTLPLGALIAGIVASSAGLGTAFAAMALLSAAQVLPFWLRFNPAAAPPK